MQTGPEKPARPALPRRPEVSFGDLGAKQIDWCRERWPAFLEMNVDTIMRQAFIDAQRERALRGDPL